MIYVAYNEMFAYSRTVAANGPAGSAQLKRERRDRRMGRTGDGRRRAVAGLQRGHSGRKEDHVDGSRKGRRGRAEVQHQRLTGARAYLYTVDTLRGRKTKTN